MSVAGAEVETFGMTKAEEGVEALVRVRGGQGEEIAREADLGDVEEKVRLDVVNARVEFVEVVAHGADCSGESVETEVQVWENARRRSSRACSSAIWRAWKELRTRRPSKGVATSDHRKLEKS